MDISANVPRWKTQIIHRVACLVGVLVKIDGLPYGRPSFEQRSSSGLTSGYSAEATLATRAASEQSPNTPPVLIR